MFDLCYLIIDIYLFVDDVLVISYFQVVKVGFLLNKILLVLWKLIY